MVVSLATGRLRPNKYGSGTKVDWRRERKYGVDSNRTEKGERLRRAHRHVGGLSQTNFVFSESSRDACRYGQRAAPLSHDHRVSLEKSLWYFSEAAPKHTADEEASLFPRLRLIDAPRIRDAFSTLDRLEADHRRADAQHLEVETIGQRWLLQGALTPEDGARLKTLLDSLSMLYVRHISLEETEIFSIARIMLSEPEKQTLGQKMAKRRGVALRDLNMSLVYRLHSE